MANEIVDNSPGGLDYHGVVGNDVSIPLDVDISLTGYTFESYVLLDDKNSMGRKQSITVTNTDLANGLVTLSLTAAQTTAMGACDCPWYFNWTSGSTVRTILRGKFRLDKY